jgi:hypothetical protein
VSAAAVPASLVLIPEDVADSMAALTETYRRPDIAGVCVVDGFGVRVVVERGALEVHDGVGPHRRTRRYDRATHGLCRLVILNAAGTFRACGVQAQDSDAAQYQDRPNRLWMPGSEHAFSGDPL